MFIFNPGRCPGLVSNALSGLKLCLFLTQGAAQGWYVTPFQGLNYVYFNPRRCPGVALGWYITHF